MPKPSQKALFLDRDGVVNEEIGYLSQPADVRWVPGLFSLCQAAQSLGYKLVIVTNQAGIARGFYTEADFQSLTQWMRNELSFHNIHIDAVYHSPYHPEHGIGDYKRDHPDRKPNPGMLLRAARDLNLDLSASILIGDRCSDIAAANAAGLREAFLLSGTETHACPQPHRMVASLEELERWLRSQLLAPSS
jgi:D-glycero-D-manno-heptose 1,7-bisphosphate phosphatase